MGNEQRTAVMFESQEKQDLNQSPEGARRTAAKYV